MNIKRIDHIVLTVTDLPRAIRFYHEVFDMPIIKEKNSAEEKCVRCGHQLIEFHLDHEKKPLLPAAPTAGSADLCIIAGDSMDHIINHLISYYVPILAGPMKRIGSEGEMTSIYINDYDHNLLEISSYK
ncbi:biphenyl-2,3-diol 1,2-dioxygenase III-related protein [Liquorilactobacillus sucicola DSM 21376 = JCM 15457]|uniref:Lactoylglutathione lyase family protein n=1 Tax=Liquorilactobacillus sucicola DSM 21376 = JCM 15457 TaxID=1423806 RepID=A0A023CZ62_9LACO|nr:VOC family protein [Liquorilactobacillus sucicola]KRN07579.1 lactoylglutathione lyase family protein [Liquorilactobacillus sucicola DSM 21376 = JCM 15457]GAJ26790.1 biphenyl-2,3-diol 1,2-dioxygenase III-related protein [Liquorilactobacillus sucicola DSM 21376 = JCM 15457]